MPNQNKLTRKEIEEKLESGEAEIHEVPPYSRINMAVSSEGFQLEIEENAPFEQTKEHYDELIRDVINKHLVGSAKKKKVNIDKVHSNVDVT